MIMSHQLCMRPTSDLSDRLNQALALTCIDQRVSTCRAPRGCVPLGLAEDNTPPDSLSCQVTRR
jgi:hypothetical protein